MSFKKLFLIIATILGVGCFTAHAGLFDSQPDQSSKEKAIASMMRAIVAEDVLSIYRLTDPTIRKKLIANAGGILFARWELNKRLKPARALIFDKITQQVGPEVNPLKFALGIIDEDPDQLWAAYNRETQKKMIADAGNKEAARKRLVPLIKDFKRLLISEAEQKIGNFFVNRKDKWFFRPPLNLSDFPQL